MNTPLTDRDLAEIRNLKFDSPSAKAVRTDLLAEVERLREIRWPMWHEIADILSADISRWPWGPRSHRAVKKRLADAANRLIRDEQVTP